MKLIQPEVNIESSQFIKETFFSVGDASIVFDILRNKIYEQPVKAIVREIACNGRDANREANKPTLPIEITLPSVFACQFEVRDFGLGISPERMEEIFVRYGTSTKRDDNIQTGAFGLGAKSPYAYTDSFTVITYIAGIQRLYTAFIDETRVGKISLNSETPTTEPDGTRIIVPVLKQDVRKFTEACQETFEYWDPLPIISGGDVVYPKKDLLLEGSNWKIFKNTYNYQYKSIILVDKIPYAYSFKKTNFPYLTYLMEFPNGVLSLSASRDYLQLDNKTEQFLEDKLVLIETGIKEQLQKKLDSIKDFREFYKFATGMGICSINFSALTWKGKSLKDFEGLDYRFSYRNCNRVDEGKTEKRTRSNHRYSAMILQDSYFILDDIEKTITYKDIKKIFDTLPEKITYIQILTPTPNNIDKIKNFVDVIVDIKASAFITKPKSTPKSPRKKKFVFRSYSYLTGKRGKYGLSRVKLDDQQISQGGGYYELYNDDKQVKDNYLNTAVIYHLKHICGISLTGFPTSDLNKLPATWKPWIDYAMEAWRNSKDYPQNIIGIIENADLNSHYYAHLNNYNGKDLLDLLKNNVDPNNIFLQFIIFQFKYTNQDNHFYNIRDLISSKLTDEEKKLIKSAAELKEEIDKKYPLIKYIFNNYSSWVSEKSFEDLVGYIKLVDHL